MLSQSMKYHNIAPIEMLEAYGRGELSVSDSRWIEQLIQKNPMVSAVAENVSSVNVAAVKSISSKTSKSIAKVYLSKIGFWSKYGVWIGLSSIVLIIGLALFFQKNNYNTEYEQTAMNKELKTPKKIPSTENIVAIVPMGVDTKENVDLTEKTSVSDAREYKNSNNLETSVPIETKEFKTASIDTHHLKVKEQQSDLDSKRNDKLIEKETPDKNSGSDNTRSFESKTKTSANQSVVLSVQNVQILSKLKPNDAKRSKKNNSKRSPMSASGGNSVSNSSFSIDDIPKFTGGDRALQDYFVGKLRPLKIKKGEDHFDRNVMVDLEINSRGKLKDYKIYGNLHPTHQKALIEAINELPRFSKGSENVVYSIAISF